MSTLFFTEKLKIATEHKNNDAITDTENYNNVKYLIIDKLT
ncbi:MAG: hypothetical protein ABF413_01270 [Liquorilactobacillus mali]